MRLSKERKLVWIATTASVALLVWASCGVMGEKSGSGTSGRGLLGCWKFDEGAGDEALDTSGNDHHGEIHGAEWVRGKFGNALHFGGQEAYVQIPQVAGLDGSNELTVEAWVYWEGGGRYPNIVTAGRWCPGGFLIFVADNGCSFRMGKPAGTFGKDWTETSSSLAQFTPGQWYHLVSTFKRPVISTYLNGKLVGSANWDYPVGYSGDLMVGTWYPGSQSHQGLIDEVRIYNRSLSADEVRMSFDKEADTRMKPLAPGEKPYEKIVTPTQAEKTAVTLENQQVRLLLDAKARVVGIVDRKSGKDYAAKTPPYFALLRKDGKEYRPTACALNQGQLRVDFGKNGSAVLDVNGKKQYFVVKVRSVTGDDVESLSYLSVRVKPAKQVSWMSGQAADDEFAFCLRTLNLQSEVKIDGNPPLLRATCFNKHGLEGAGAILATCPPSQLRPVLQEAFRAEGVLTSPLGGPSALDAPENRYSYLFSSVSEKNVDEWIELAKRSGTPIIHLGSWEKSLGHYEPHPSLFPRGLAGLKQVADKIHAAGLKISMHTLTGCIAPQDPFITPVPDKRLAKDKVFTLSQPLDEKATEVFTEEPLSDMDTVWGYASRGNYVQVGDELIQFSGYTDKPPYKFTGCTRGALGTKVAAHAKGAQVGHLFAYYGCFYPDADSTLVDEIADCIARVANECRMDLIYEDGSEGMPGGWHGVATMRAAIVKRINHPIRVEASEWGYHSWSFHSCIGAWDYPCWALKRFIDLHCKESEAYRLKHLLPGHLGWWVILGPANDYDGEMPEDIEYLCSKAIGYNLSSSFQGVSPERKPWNARQDEYLTKIGQYERLRMAGYFSEAVREKLKTPKEEYRLSQSADGEWQLTPTDYTAHKVTGLTNGSTAWTMKNRFGQQPAKLRIQALYGVAPYDSPSALTLADFSTPDQFIPSATSDVTATFRLSKDQVKVGTASGCLEASSKAKNPLGAWAKANRIISPEVSLGKCGALGLWVYGDGKGELLNVQLTDSPVYYHGAFDEHYIDVDFTGWRYFELPIRERDAERYGDYVWPYGNIYSIYRTPLMRDHVQGLNFYFNNIPTGESVKCYVSSVKALPVVKVKLTNPSVMINGHKLTFPVTLESGQYLELESMADCRLYDERGELIQRVTPQGDLPTMAAGDNAVEFSCLGPEGHNARANVTLITQGKSLRGVAPKEKIDWKWLKAEYDEPRIIQSLDGKQNVWETICRKDARDARIQFEVIVDRVGKTGAGYDDPNALTVESFDDLSRFADSPDNQFAKYVWDSEHKGVGDKPGVTHKLEQSSQVTKVGKSSLRFTATSARKDDAGWCAQGERFNTPLDLSKCKALGFWIYGDGNGESLKLQLRDLNGAWQDMVTPIDFTGWKYVEFDLGSTAGIDLSKIEYAIIFYNNLPGGKTVTCHVDDIRALREVGVLRNPSVSIAGKRVTFPVALSAGERLVYRSPKDCRVYSRDGSVRQLAGSPSPTGLKPGRNSVAFGLGDGNAQEFQVRVMTSKAY